MANTKTEEQGMLPFPPTGPELVLYNEKGEKLGTLEPTWDEEMQLAALQRRTQVDPRILDLIKIR